MLVYSSQAATRGRVISALGTPTHPDLPRLDHLEVATAAAAIRAGMDLMGMRQREGTETPENVE